VIEINFFRKVLFKVFCIIGTCSSRIECMIYENVIVRNIGELCRDSSNKDIHVERVKPLDDLING